MGQIEDLRAVIMALSERVDALENKKAGEDAVAELTQDDSDDSDEERKDFQEFLKNLHQRVVNLEHGRVDIGTFNELTAKVDSILRRMETPTLAPKPEPVNVPSEESRITVVSGDMPAPPPAADMNQTGPSDASNG